MIEFVVRGCGVFFVPQLMLSVLVVVPCGAPRSIRSLTSTPG